MGAVGRRVQTSGCTMSKFWGSYTRTATRVNDTVLCISKLLGCGPGSPVENHCSKLIKRDHLPWCLKARFLGPVWSRAVSAATRWERWGDTSITLPSHMGFGVEICSGAPRRLPTADAGARDAHGHPDRRKVYTRAKEQVFSSRCPLPEAWGLPTAFSLSVAVGGYGAVLRGRLGRSLLFLLIKNPCI